MYDASIEVVLDEIVLDDIVFSIVDENVNQF